MIPVDVPVPPNLEAVLGYDPQNVSVFLGFFWTPAGDTATYCDGFYTMDADKHGFRVYYEHPQVFPNLARYNLGNSDEYPEYWAILDRVQRRLYVEPAEKANAFLRESVRKLPNHPVLSLPEAEQKQVVDALIGKAIGDTTISYETTQAMMREQVRAAMNRSVHEIRVMLDFLNRRN